MPRGHSKGSSATSRLVSPQGAHERDGAGAALSHRGGSAVMPAQGAPTAHAPMLTVANCLRAGAWAWADR